MPTMRSWFANYPNLQFLYDLAEELERRAGGMTTEHRLLIDPEGNPLTVDTTFTAHTTESEGGIDDRNLNDPAERFAFYEEIVQLATLISSGIYDAHELHVIEERAALVVQALMKIPNIVMLDTETFELEEIDLARFLKKGGKVN